MSELEELTIEWSLAHDEYTPLYARMHTARFFALPKELQDKEYAEFQVPYQKYERLTRQLVKIPNPVNTKLEKLIASWSKAVLLHCKWIDECSGYPWMSAPPEEEQKLHEAYIAREEKEEQLLEACRKIR